MRRALPWIVVAPWAAWALVRGAGLDLGHPLVSVITFTPYAAVTSCIPIAVAAATRHRAAGVLAIAAAAVLVGSVAPRAVGGDQPEADGPRLTVMTSNLLGSRADAERIVELVREQDVDVLSLQELTTNVVLQLNAARIQDVLPFAIVEPRDDPSGLGLFSRHRPRRLGPHQVETVPRLEAAIAVSGAPPVVVRAVHPLPPLNGRAEHNWRRDLRAMPAAGDGPLRILAGDFNATLDHRELRRLIERGYADAADRVGAGLRPTWPVGRPHPPITIDHVLLDRQIAVESVTVHEVAGSDHRAVVARLRLP